MAGIGTFKYSADDDSFVGEINTLTLKLTARMIHNPTRENDKAPDYRLVAGSIECGAVWHKHSTAVRDYFSVKFDDPTFPNPIYATLIAA
ncbi:hypothetical protein BSL82_18380 (plasmid) [Tardibacter chloracetimidivorans]|uniref:DUF736 domain-containing protein n=1 Tax=Tardibacter chloracetimidivorans TaxID=1921510 RepID=A0A1L4A0I6_9SPHN|nr:DUF736 domain-containing protein [Tardibacter chloracetimidivorans]API61407.1 hypothetical protein BSL82_18380 [Tardibacter chloracetimidivorans]